MMIDVEFCDFCYIILSSETLSLSIFWKKTLIEIEKPPLQHGIIFQIIHSYTHLLPYNYIDVFYC